MLREDKTDVSAKAALVQQAYEDLADELQRTPAWSADWEQAFDHLESYIFEQTAQEYTSSIYLYRWRCLWRSVLARDLQDARKDEVLEDCIRAMQHLPIDALWDVEPDKSVDGIAEQAKLIIMQLNDVGTPKDKLDLLVRFCKFVVKGLGEAGILTDSDHVIPMVMYTLVSAKAPLLVANLAYIRRFRCRHRIDGESLFSLTTVIAAVQSISNLNTKHPEALFPDDEDAVLKKSASMTLVQPISDLTQNVYKTFISIPTNFTMAVTDTLKLRSVRLKSSSSSSTCPVRRQSSFVNVEPSSLGGDGQAKAFQERILATNSVDELTLGDVAHMFLDYKRLLASIHYDKK